MTSNVSQDYINQNFKIPTESPDYPEVSSFVIKSIEGIIENAIKEGKE